MKNTSYLLYLDGSEESRQAAYFAWQLAEQSGAQLVAQYVIDTAGLWNFLSYDSAGFIGSGPYVEASERIVDVLRSLSESLFLSYCSQAQGRRLSVQTAVDEGDPADEIARRALNHDLVIIGYRSRSYSQSIILEKLVRICSCPILLLRSASNSWSKLQIVATGDTNDLNKIAELYRFGEALCVPVELYFATGVKETNTDRFQFAASLGGASSIREGDLETVVDSASDSTLIAASGSVLFESNFSRNPTLLRRFLDHSEHRAVLLWA